MEAPLETKTPKNEGILPYETVVVGGGPIGLLAAVTAAVNHEPGKKVAVLADRLGELGVRQQVLWFEQDVYDFLKKMIGDDILNRALKSTTIIEDAENGYYITTGALEDLLLTAITTNEELGKKIEIIETEKLPVLQDPEEAQQESKASKKGKAEDFIKINDKKSTITVIKKADPSSRPETVCLRFKYLIAADGSKRSVAKSLYSKGIKFDETQAPILHTKHAVATFKLPEGVGARACDRMKVKPPADGPENTEAPEIKELDVKKRVIRPHSMAELREYGWTSHTRPYSQIYTTGDVVYIGAEIPSDLTDRAKILAYSRLLMADQLPREFVDEVKEIKSDGTPFGDKKAQLSVSVFDLQMGEINQTAYVTGEAEEEEDRGVIFFMGDAKKNPLYTTGTGVQTGVREVMHFDKFLTVVANVESEAEEKSSQKKAQGPISMRMTDSTCFTDCVVEYHNETRKILDNIHQLQNKWIEGRKEKDAEAHANHIVFKESRKTIKKLVGCLNCIGTDFLPGIEVVSSQSGQIAQLMNSVKRLTHLMDAHSKLISCCEDESHITSYNGVHVEKFFKELHFLATDMYNKYPTKESMIEILSKNKALNPELRKGIEEFYNELEKISSLTETGLREIRTVGEGPRKTQ